MFMLSTSYRLFKKGDFTSAIQSYKMSLRYCPLEDEFNKDRVRIICQLLWIGNLHGEHGCCPDRVSRGKEIVLLNRNNLTMQLKVLPKQFRTIPPM